VTDVSQCTVIVLAAQRTGVVNPLAQKCGVSHKCIVPICGRPLIVHVMDVLASLPQVKKVRIAVEPEVHDELGTLLAPYRGNGLDFEFIASSENIVESVVLASEGQVAPFIVTTADNVLLSPDQFRITLAALETHDAAMNLAAKTSVQAIHPEAQRRFYEFRDEGYANCNLYGIAGPHALKAAEVFREGGQFMNNPKRLVTAFGLFNIILFRLKVLTLAQAAKRLSRKFGLKAAMLVPADGAQAVDVDNERTYEVAEMVLKQRSGGT
jgi:GTP:adenosylcobinamide-phosphate guanylyltransferase